MSNTRTLSFRFPFALVLSICCLTTPVWADFETGMDAYQRGNYATALSEWRPLAEEGDAQAQLYLGLLYAKGDGVPQDYAKHTSGMSKPPIGSTRWRRPTSGCCIKADMAYSRTMCVYTCCSASQQPTRRATCRSPQQTLEITSPIV